VIQTIYDIVKAHGGVPIAIGSGISLYVDAAKKAKELGLGLNAGHDLDLNNLKYLKQHIPWLDEVSIGHALVCDAIYLGLGNTIQLYKRQLQ
jgi:pyridoxine 5-phosphate synthase